MDQTKPTLLFVTTELPYPPDSGGRIKTFRLLQFLTLHYNVKLICAFGGKRKKAVEAMKAAIPGLSYMQVFDNHQPRTAINFFVALMTSPSFNAFRIYSKELETMIKWSAEASDVLMVDHAETIDLVPEEFKGKIIYHSHNAEFKLWSDFATMRGTFLTKWMLEWEASRVKQLERYAIKRSTFTFAAPNDQEALKAELGIEDSKFRLTYHLGNDALLELDDINLKANGKEIFYAGTLSWEPNRDGIQWFIEQCWPMIHEKEPSAVLNVCGGGADEDLLKLMEKTAGVNALGFVNDLESIMQKSRCAIVPLRFGSGMKIKTFDALYRGLPLTTTTIGAEGIALENKKHAHIVDEDNAFADAVISVLNDTDAATTLRDQGRSICRAIYSYPSMLQGMLEDIRSMH
jgi:glycosyltransferase involved in cell wall biosynthesis